MNKRRLLLSVILLIFIMVIWVLWANTALEVSEYTICSDKIPESFDGYRIVQISDLHNASFGENNDKLLKMIEAAEPDMILITGDLVDSWNTDIHIGIRFAEAVTKIAPTYFVTGNHEARISQYDTLKSGLEESGVVILENEGLLIEHDGEQISLIGLDDPSFRTSYLIGNEKTVTAEMLVEPEGEAYTILLAHRPELFDTYVEAGVDLVFSGHAHGGQFRLPFIGGLYAPGQGLFPEYDAGIYTQATTTMVVSRGLGNSIFPVRINNRPEVVIVILEST